jgi:hypothetical protein
MKCQPNVKFHTYSRNPAQGRRAAWQTTPVHDARETHANMPCNTMPEWQWDLAHPVNLWQPDHH